MTYRFLIGLATAMLPLASCVRESQQTGNREDARVGDTYQREDAQ